ncbi:lipopolysaccharide biosynthesis protein [Vibrio cholerae]|uniref:lipopolysaccharide biosynthesis protein n=1 Tax=Vibrio cholerae TaxID=666 RepID=UPI003D7C5800
MNNFITNTLWSLLSFSLRLLSNVVIYIIIARFFGPEKFGQFSTYVLACTIIFMISDSGIHQRYFKALSISEKCEVINELVMIKLLFFLISTLISITYSLYIQSLSALFLCVSFLINGAYDFMLINLRSSGRFKDEAWYAFVNNVLFFAFSITALYLDDSIFFLSLAMFLARVIVLLFLIKKEALHVDLSYKMAVIKGLISHIYYFLDFTLTNVWSFLDGLIVRLIYSNYIFGIYSSYTRISNGISGLSIVLTNVLFSKIALDAQKRKHSWLLLGVSIFIFMGSILSSFLFFLGDEIILILLGESYKEYSPLLLYLMIPVILKWLSSSLGVYLFALGLVKSRVLIQTISIVVFFTALFALHRIQDSIFVIPISMSIAYLTIFIFYSILVVRK